MAAEAGAVTLESSTDLPLNDATIDLVCFTIGERFSLCLHLEEKVAAYENAKSVQLSHSESKTLQAVSKRIPLNAAKANQDLVYYYINLCCVFGGKKYQAKRKRKETNQKSVLIHLCSLYS